jgi:poly [ADP-ribose] polymerase 10/14/15
VSKQATEDEANVFADTGWFQLDATCMPSADDLAALQKNVGDTGALEAPSHWDPVVDPSVAQQHAVKEGDPEYASVVQSFISTLSNRNVKILKVERIQNLGMWQSYVVKRQTICYRETGISSGDITAVNADTIQQNALKRFEKRWLWHGTNVEVMDKILQQGFNRSFCGKNATAYGKGVYFARDASYSSYKTYAQPDSNGNQYIMACRVVVGEYCRGTMDALTPNIRDAKSQSLYDTTVGLLTGDTMPNPSIYVTYHDAQAYPEVSFVGPLDFRFFARRLSLTCVSTCVQYLIKFKQQ